MTDPTKLAESSPVAAALPRPLAMAPTAAAVWLLVALAMHPGGAVMVTPPGLQARVDAIERRFEAELSEMRGELERMGARLDRCESDTASVGQTVAVIHDRRRAQDEAQCQGAGMQAMLTACCPAGGGGGGGQHRRELQGGCSGFPASCTTECATLFVEYYEACQRIIIAMPAGEKAEFDSFFGQCSEAIQVAAGMMQPVQVQMFRVSLSTEGAPMPPPPAESGTAAAGSVHEYHAECSGADISSCVPACNAEHHGYELLATIDGNDAKFSCKLSHGLYSWMGAASDGGFIGTDSGALISALAGGAPGAFAVILAQHVTVASTIRLQRDQHVYLSAVQGSGDELISWSCSGVSFDLREQSMLSLVNLHLPGRSTVETRQGSILKMRGVTAGYEWTTGDPCNACLADSQCPNTNRCGPVAISGTMSIGGSGGGVGSDEAVGIITDCRFEHFHLYIGQGSTDSGTSTVTIENSVFTGCGSRSGNGGAIDVHGNANVVVTGCQFVENQGQYGGAMTITDYAVVQISGSSFNRNTAIARGGALYLSETAALTLDSCEFSGNTAAEPNTLPDGWCSGADAPFCGGDGIYQNKWANGSNRVTPLTISNEDATGHQLALLASPGATGR